MKRVLIIGPRFYGYSQSVGKAFKRLNYDVSIMEWVEGGVENFAEKIRYNLAGDKQQFFDNKDLYFNKRVSEQYRKLQPEIVFVIRGSVINRETLKFMSSSMVILWMMDSIFRVEKTLNNINLYHKVFLFEKEDIPVLKARYGIDGFFLPLALDESVYYPVPQKHKPIDILFVGALYDDRIKLLRKICERYPGKRIKIYGIYFSKLRNPGRYLFRKDKEFFTNKTLQPSELNIKYSETKVCLNMHHSQSIYGVNQRFFELSGAKAMQVCDRRGFIEDNFSGKQVLLYGSEKELFDLLDVVIEHHDRYEEMKDSIYSEVIARHTFLCRMKEVVNICGMQA